MSWHLTLDLKSKERNSAGVYISLKKQQRLWPHSSRTSCSQVLGCQLTRNTIFPDTESSPGAMGACKRDIWGRWSERRGPERQTWICRTSQGLRRPQQPWEHMVKLSRKAQNFQQGRRLGQRLRASVCHVLHNSRRPMEPFQHQQSPSQKTNLASQGLSVKKGCLGCKRNWNCFFLSCERSLRRWALIRHSPQSLTPASHACG